MPNILDASMVERFRSVVEECTGLGFVPGKSDDLPELLAEVARHYLSRAMEVAHGNKTRAAAMLGLPSYQTLTNWLEKYGSAAERGRS